ncbi:MAG: hypothetical protein AB7U20_16645, partial [Planctomycetaceae bacterium]
ILGPPERHVQFTYTSYPEGRCLARELAHQRGSSVSEIWESAGKRNVFKRRRLLALSMPSKPMTPEGLLTQSEELLGQYIGMDGRVLTADLAVLVKLGLIQQEGETYGPAIQDLSGHIPGFKP